MEKKISRKELSSIDSRNAILKASLHLFSRKGYHGTRVKEIAELAGVSEGLIYHHFQGKYDLLLGVFKHCIQIQPDVVREKIRKLNGSGKGIEKPEAILKLLFASVSDHVKGDESPGKIFPVILNSMSALNRAEKEQFVKEIHEQYWSPFTEILSDVIPPEKRGTVDPYYLFRILHGIFMGYYLFQDYSGWNEFVEMNFDHYVDIASSLLGVGLEYHIQ